MQWRQFGSAAKAEPPKARRRLFSPTLIAVFAMVVIIVFVLIFPQRSIVEEILRGDYAVNFSIATLQGLLEVAPEAEGLRLMLARKQTLAGELEAARKTIRPLFTSADDRLRRHVGLVNLEILRAEANSRSPGSRGREVVELKAREYLHVLAAKEWDMEGLLILAESAHALGEVALAVGLQGRITRQGAQQSYAWLEAMGSRMVGKGDYRLAASFYFAAKLKSRNRDLRRRYFVTAVRALQGGNLMDEALTQAEAQLGGLESDTETLVFMAKLARAADRPKLAEKYIKRALRIPVGDGQEGRTGLGWLAWIGVSPLHAAPAAPGLPFDNEIYTLAYEIFLANGNVEDAYSVAEVAVAHVPGDLEWRRRFARVADWTQRPGMALRQWLFIVKVTGDIAAYREVVRLAPGLFDYDNLILGLRTLAAREGLTDEQLRSLVRAYEAAGRPEEGLEYLRDLYQKQSRRIVLELIAYLYERMGDGVRALQTYGELEQRYGASPELGMKQATWFYIHGDTEGAYGKLHRVKGQAAAKDTAFWQLYAELAWQLQKDDDASGAYIKLQRAGELGDGGLVRVLTLLDPARSPEAVGEFAELAWHRLRQPHYFLKALDVAYQRKDWRRLGFLFGSLSEEALSLFRRREYGYFWVIRAWHHQYAGRPKKALRDHLYALTREPDSTKMRASLLWLLVEQKDRTMLKRYTKKWHGVSKEKAGLWGPFAAAYVTLEKPNRALFYYGKKVARHEKDYLWLLSYADVLEQAGRVGLAWRVRRYVWFGLRAELANTDTAAVPDKRLLAVARLALTQAPGDTAARLIRKVIQRRYDADAQELILGWALSSEQYDAARAWLWRGYARQLSRPPWAEFSLALVAGDADAMERLLRIDPQRLPVYDRIYGAQQSAHPRMAQEQAFTALGARPNDDQLHQLLLEATLPAAKGVVVALRSRRRGTVVSRIAEIGGRVRLGRSLILATRLRMSRQRGRDERVTRNLPRYDRRLELTARHAHAHGETRIGVAQRRALSTVTPLWASLEQRWRRRLSTRLRLERSGEADDTVALSTGGVKDELRLGLGYDFTWHEYADLRVGWKRFYSQDRSYLGRGVTLDWEIGHRVRREYPDLSVRLSGTVARFKADGTVSKELATLVPDGVEATPSFFIPGDFSLWCLGLGLGEYYRTDYTRGLRPFFSASLCDSSTGAAPYSFSVGLAGSILGGDSLAINLSEARDVKGIGEVDRQIGMQYAYFF